MTQVVTVVDATVPVDKEGELLDGFRRLLATGRPDGLVRSQLLRGQSGRWRIETTWRDRDAVLALRARGEPHAAAALLDAVGATHTHDVFTVEEAG